MPSIVTRQRLTKFRLYKVQTIHNNIKKKRDRTQRSFLLLFCIFTALKIKNQPLKAILFMRDTKQKVQDQFPTSVNTVLGTFTSTGLCHFAFKRPKVTFYDEDGKGGE